MKKTLFALVMLVAGAAYGQTALEPHSYAPEGAQKVVYKNTGQEELNIWVIRPDTPQSEKKNPAIAFFFGGGWNSGSVAQFEPHGHHLADRGMTVFLVEYRTKKSSGTSPLESVADARSAMRYIRANARTFGIDPKRIAASGGSAGGHLAAAAAYVTAFDDPADNKRVDATPNALVLFNPVVDNSGEGYGKERLGDRWSDFSPMHNVTKKNVRPTLFIVGSKDHLIPVSTAEKFGRICTEAGGRYELAVYEGAGHGFFNYDRRGREEKDYYDLTLRAMDDFLVSIGYLPAK